MEGFDLHEVAALEPGLDRGGVVVREGGPDFFEFERGVDKVEALALPM